VDGAVWERMERLVILPAKGVIFPDPGDVPDHDCVDPIPDTVIPYPCRSLVKEIVYCTVSLFIHELHPFLGFGIPDTQSSLLLCMDGLVVGDLLIVPLLDLKEPFNDESCPGNTVVTGKSVPDPQVDGQIPAIIL